MHTYLFSPSWLSQRSSMDLLGFFASIRQSDTFFGISFQVWIFVILGAVTWAATWVLNLKPAKDRRMGRELVGFPHLAIPKFNRCIWRTPFWDGLEPQIFGKIGGNQIPQNPCSMDTLVLSCLKVR